MKPNRALAITARLTIGGCSPVDQTAWSVNGLANVNFQMWNKQSKMCIPNLGHGNICHIALRKLKIACTSSFESSFKTLRHATSAARQAVLACVNAQRCSCLRPMATCLYPAMSKICFSWWTAGMSRKQQHVTYGPPPPCDTGRPYHWSQAAVIAKLAFETPWMQQSICCTLAGGIRPLQATCTRCLDLCYVDRRKPHRGPRCRTREKTSDRKDASASASAEIANPVVFRLSCIMLHASIWQAVSHKSLSSDCHLQRPCTGNHAFCCIWLAQSVAEAYCLGTSDTSSCM